MRIDNDVSSIGNALANFLSTTSIWAFAKVFGATGVIGIVVALIGNALFEYADKE